MAGVLFTYPLQILPVCRIMEALIIGWIYGSGSVPTEAPHPHGDARTTDTVTQDGGQDGFSASDELLQPMLPRRYGSQDEVLTEDSQHAVSRPAAHHGPADQEIDVLWEQGDTRIRVSIVILRIIVVGASAVLAVAVPSLHVVIAFVGSLGGGALAYVFPAVLDSLLALYTRGPQVHPHGTGNAEFSSTLPAYGLSVEHPPTAPAAAGGIHAMGSIASSITIADRWWLTRNLLMVLFGTVGAICGTYMTVKDAL